MANYRKPWATPAEAFAHIRPGSRVTILVASGQDLKADHSRPGVVRYTRVVRHVERHGRAVMLGPAGWVLDMGGMHGIPGIADVHNVVAVRGKRVEGR